MSIPRYFTIEQPTATIYRYGLFSAAPPVVDESLDWQLGVQYITSGCALGGLWDVRCGETFTVTITTDGTTSVQVDAAPAGIYTVSVDGGAAEEFDSSTTLTLDLGNTYEVTITDSLGRSVTTTVDPSLTGSTDVTSQAQADNDPKTLTETSIVQGDPFTVYDGVQCDGPTADFARFSAEARRNLEASEQRRVEEWLHSRYLAQPDTVVLEGGAPTPLKEAVGALEEVLSQSYNFVGVLHAPRFMGVYASDRSMIFREGSQQSSPLGTRWVFGGGYLNTGPEGTTAPDGQVWLYATGGIHLRRSPVNVISPLDAGGFDTENNRAFVLAERSYVLVPSCVRYAVLADLTGEG